MIGALAGRRIRLERPQLILLALAIFFTLLNVWLLTSFLAADRQRDALAAQVGQLERALQRLQARGAGPGTGAALQPGENPFPRDLPSADLTNLVVQAAQASGVRVESMAPQLGQGETFVQGSGRAYRTYKLALRVVGTPTQLADFLSRVERGPIRAWVIDNTQARPLPGSPNWEVAFDVTTYAQPAA